MTAAALAGLLVALAACGARTPAPMPAGADVPEARVTVTAPPLSQAPAPMSAAELYAASRARVEGTEAPGECASDADCARAGCSQEVCVPARSAGEVITTCEILPVFSALDACGCHAGTCGWTLKEPVLRTFPVSPRSSPAGTPG